MLNLIAKSNCCDAHKSEPMVLRVERTLLILNRYGALIAINNASFGLYEVSLDLRHAFSKLMRKVKVSLIEP